MTDAEEQTRKIEEILSGVNDARDDFVHRGRPAAFDYLSRDIHETNVEKGFWGPPEQMDKWVAKLALVHSEVTEVMEALRKSQGPDAVTEEMADILIRLFDLYGVLVEAGEASPRLYKVMTDKMQKNAERAPKHGNRWG